MPKQLILALRGRELFKESRGHRRAGREGPAQGYAVPKAPARFTTDPQRLRRLAFKTDPDQESSLSLSEALALSRDDPKTLRRLAESSLRQGELDQALGHFRRIVELRPQSAPAHTDIALTEERLGDLPAAAKSYRRALALDPGSAQAHCQLAIVLRQLGGLPEALRLSERAVGLDPGRFESYNTLGIVLADMRNLAAATEAFRRSFALKPDSAATAVDLGYFFVKCGDIPAAADAYRWATKLDPNLYAAHLRLGTALTQLGDRAGAWKCYQHAQALCPGSSEVITYMGLLHLAEGNFRLGWGEYEYRESARRARKRLSPPQWKGEPLKGAQIFLHAEQGLGDALQCVRYVPLVAKRGGEVVLGVQKRLHRLLARTEGARQVVSDAQAPPEFSWHCPLLSLPLAFATDLSTIPAGIPYVHPDPRQIETWGRRLQGDSFRIGLAWGGNPNYPHELWRSIALEQLAPLTFLEGTTFYSLQLGAPARQVRQLGPSVQIVDLQDEQKDLGDTAAIVAHLDLVISIDTSIAHLAGAMGKPVWILLNNSPDWRWLLEREDSPWYPTARLFRQSAFGNWQAVVARVERELRALVAKTSVDKPRGSDMRAL
jgi:tetratricopeptide (TPR) repeat protein